MGETSKIEWTDATVNFWWGCTKVGPGCYHCYAETFDKRTGGRHWGIGQPRRKIESAVKTIHKLDNRYSEWAADAECARGNSRAFGLPVPLIGNRRRVFIQSMSDLFDLEVPFSWFLEAWGHIEGCDRIDVQIVTKRVSAVEKRLAEIGRTTWPKHVGLMATVVNQDEADRDVPRLLDLKEKLGIPWVGLSIEPMLGPVDLHAIAVTRDHPNLMFPDWIICGGESGAHRRRFDVAWAESLQRQCADAKIAFFMKQIDKKTPIPEHLMTRQFPAALGGAL